MNFSQNKSVNSQFTTLANLVLYLNSHLNLNHAVFIEEVKPKQHYNNAQNNNNNNNNILLGIYYGCSNALVSIYF